MTPNWIRRASRSNTTLVFRRARGRWRRGVRRGQMIVYYPELEEATTITGTYYQVLNTDLVVPARRPVGFYRDDDSDVEVRH